MLQLLQLFFFSLFACVSARTICTELVISDGVISPDGVEKRTLLVNGTMPGPAIHVTVGDILELNIRNEAAEGVTIHLHGIKQLKTPFYDGAAHISQNLIEGGRSFKLVVHMDEEGTYFYHSHNMLQDMSVFGPLIVHEKEKPADYDEERIIMLSDWWLKDTATLVSGLLNPNFTFVGLPQSLLTNGKTKFNSTVGEYSVTNVEPGKTYRFRIIGSLSLVYLAFRIQEHEMTLYEADGHRVSPVKLPYLELNAGQRYSVLVKVSPEPGDYWTQSGIKWRNATVDNGLSILRVAGNAVKTLAPPTLTDLPAETPEWSTTRVTALKSTVPQGPASRTFMLWTKQERVIDVPTNISYLRWTTNNISFVMPQDKPLLWHAYDGTDGDLPRESRMQTLKYNEIIDLVIQNTVALNGVCEEHPWHLHGHSFWDLGGGPGAYTPSVSVNFNNPPYRDTATVYAHSSAWFQPKEAPGSPCGWRVVRFRADNPGVWPFHCHITSHLIMGMGVVFKEAFEMAPRPPPSYYRRK